MRPYRGTLLYLEKTTLTKSHFFGILVKNDISETSLISLYYARPKSTLFPRDSLLRKIDYHLFYSYVIMKKHYFSLKTVLNNNSMVAEASLPNANIWGIIPKATWRVDSARDEVEVKNWSLLIERRNEFGMLRVKKYGFKTYMSILQEITDLINILIFGRKRAKN